MWLCVGVCVLFFHSNFCVSTAENRLEFQCYQVRMTEGDSEEQRNWNICKKVILRTDLVIMPNKKGDEVKEWKMETIKCLKEALDFKNCL